MPIITADGRQCRRLDQELTQDVSRACAPTARRRPISRVRSVTDTSMIFMMPMPPTSSDTAATAASSMRQRIGGGGRGVGDLGQIADREILLLIADDPVSLPQQIGHQCDAGLDVFLVGELHENGSDGAISGIVAADHATAAGIEGHEDHVVLILAECRLSLGCHHADDAERNVADPNGAIDQDLRRRIGCARPSRPAG